MEYYIYNLKHSEADETPYFLWMETRACMGQKLKPEEIKVIEKNLPTLIQTNETKKSTQIDAFFESKPKMDAFLKIDANGHGKEYKKAS